MHVKNRKFSVEKISTIIVYWISIVKMFITRKFRMYLLMHSAETEQLDLAGQQFEQYYDNMMSAADSILGNRDGTLDELVVYLTSKDSVRLENVVWSTIVDILASEDFRKKLPVDEKVRGKLDAVESKLDSLIHNLVIYTLTQREIKGAKKDSFKNELENEASLYYNNALQFARQLFPNSEESVDFLMCSFISAMKESYAAMKTSKLNGYPI